MICMVIIRSHDIVGFRVLGSTFLDGGIYLPSSDVSRRRPRAGPCHTGDHTHGAEGCQHRGLGMMRTPRGKEEQVLHVCGSLTT